MIKNPEVFYFIFGVKIKISEKWIFWTKILFWHSVYDRKIKNAQAMQLSTFRLLTKMTSGILRFLHLAQYMMWLMWRILTPRLRDRKYFVTLKSYFFPGLTSMVSANTRMYKKKLGMVDYARKSTRNVRTPSSIILHLSGNRLMTGRIIHRKKKSCIGDKLKKNNLNLVLSNLTTMVIESFTF